MIGAGLAGLVRRHGRWQAQGAKVELIEAAGQAGEARRSYFDAVIGGIIDNGNHLVLSGNRAVNDYLKHALARQNALVKVRRAPSSDFVDLARWRAAGCSSPTSTTACVLDRARWPARAGHPRIGLCRLCQTHVGQPQAYRRPDSAKGALWDRLMHPFLLAALNTEPWRVRRR